MENPFEHRPVSEPKKVEKSTHILIVDDQPRMRETMQSMLRGRGYRNTLVAQDGREALQRIHTSFVEMVITDWTMPNMTGIELLKTIKGNLSSYLIPVLMISDEGTVEKVMYAIEEGVDDFLVKPFSENTLIASITSVLNKDNHPDTVKRLYDAMRRLKLSGQYEEAVKLGEQVLKKHQVPRVALLACECLYLAKKYEKAMEMILDSSEESRTGKHISMLGNIFLALGNTKEAILYLEESAKRNPLNQERRIDLARAHMSMGQVEEAERVIRSCLQSGTTDPVLAGIAQLYLDFDDLDKAGYFLDKTVDPILDALPVFNFYAIALRKAGKFQDSARIYRKCVRIDPESDILHYNLGFLYAITGKLKEAREALENSLRLNPQSEPSRELIDRIEQSPESLQSFVHQKELQKV